MAKGRELKGRIKSVENTRKITRTMEMVATSKMKRAQDRVVAARPYARALGEVIASLYSPELAERFPLLRQPEREGRAAVILLTSNRGLAGAFNANLIKEARTLLARLESAGTTVELHVVGKKGVGYFGYVGRALATTRTDLTDRPTAADAASLVDGLIGRFTTGELDAVYVVGSRFNSVLSTPPTADRILPVTPPAATGAQKDYLLFPSAETILTELLPSYVRNAVYRALVETAAAEQAARRTAMKSATDNAGEMLNLLRRTYNRARQAQITQEIAEIVGGASALQG
ncbi:MAG: ATP synthase F1 subunit gamma [Gemmatimonadota bacterium]|jgi:F-type H+-transporting ATPase subunit gamma|nr:ATP synthase F1 subunit gamma [Gemmatimonadota bacterium]MDQ8150552.1 ATP synthase F1 subunit gamma [Gemmatimonadota bacterium]MDQ8151420.1 ATP synthase F1 subunit gamma [Gemmatimonadota bacterium]